MSKTLTFILFISLGTLIISFINYCIWLRLVRDTGLSGSYRDICTYTLIALAVSFPTAVIASRLLAYQYSLPILWISYLWLGIMMLFAFTLLAADVVRLLHVLYLKITSQTGAIPVDPERRAFLKQALALGTSGVVLALSAWGVKNYMTKAIVKQVEVSLSGLPEAFKGFRIIQISDLHVGQLMTGSKLKEVVDQVNALKPDLIAITGDLADGSTDKLLAEITSLKDLQADHGVFFVTGNHEYYNGVEDWTREIRKMGIQVLNNENLTINRGTDFIYLAGVTDHEAVRYGESHAADFKKALGGLAQDKKKILLAHQPIAVREATEYGADLVLSGHTHGGQIWPFTYLVYLQQPYLKGLYQHKDTKLYVNQGTGCWGPPMRVGSLNEITEITLT
jgi:predicted MPP superfamily phosphohydrolase